MHTSIKTSNPTHTSVSRTIKNKVYKFVEYKDFVVHDTGFKGKSFNKDFLLIEADGTITIRCSFKDTGYAWDGCSPKWNWIDITWGTPDGRLDWNTVKPITYYASMVHDVLYQYKREHDITRKQTDQLFRELLKKEKFKLATIYYWAVRVFGGFYGKWKVKYA